MSQTKQEYNEVLTACREVFLKKNQDYGTSWRLFRPSSLTDQIYIKAQRIRNIEESGNNAVGDDIRGEFMGIVNYSLIALIQLVLELWTRSLATPALSGIFAMQMRKRPKS